MNFLSSIPVRKQIALKNSVKTLAQVKRLLQSYALVRHNVRFSLKILKANNDKSNWVYVPGRVGSLEEACYSVIGRACWQSCLFETEQNNEFRIDALVPRANADPQKISKVGQFVSVDRRPLSSSSSIHKQMVSTVKSRLVAVRKDFERVKNVFMWLNITCPVGSYDPNIEPSKDDVLFQDDSIILSTLQMMLGRVYVNECPTILQREISTEGCSQGGPVNQRAEEVAPRNVERLAHRTNQATGLSPYLSNMHERGDDETWIPDEETQSGAVTSESLKELRNIAVSNPWSIAKLHASTKTPGNLDKSRSISQYRLRSGDINGQRGPVKISDTNLSSQSQRKGLPTPEPSSPFAMGKIEPLPGHQENTVRKPELPRKRQSREGSSEILEGMTSHSRRGGKGSIQLPLSFGTFPKDSLRNKTELITKYPRSLSQAELPKHPINKERPSTHDRVQLPPVSSATFSMNSFPNSDGMDLLDASLTSQNGAEAQNIPPLGRSMISSEQISPRESQEIECYFTRTITGRTDRSDLSTGQNGDSTMNSSETSLADAYEATRTDNVRDFYCENAFHDGAGCAERSKSSKLPSCSTQPSYRVYNVCLILQLSLPQIAQEMKLVDAAINGLDWTCSVEVCYCKNIDSSRELFGSLWTSRLKSLVENLESVI